MMAVVADSSAPVPAPSRVMTKDTTPPTTGSAAFRASTITTRGLAKASPVAADCGAGSGSQGEEEPLALEGADVTGTSSGEPRWSVTLPLTAVPAPMAGLPGRSAMVWVGPP